MMHLNNNNNNILCSFEKVERQEYMMMKLRGGTAAFQIEVGRWKGVAREERLCKELVEKWKMSATGCCVAMHGTS